MKKPVVALCLLFFSALSQALDVPGDDEEVRSKPLDAFAPFVVELFLVHGDENDYALELDSHFPPQEGDLLDSNNGWKVFLVNDMPGLSTHDVPTMRLLFADEEDPGAEIDLTLHARPVAANGIAQRVMRYLRPPRSGLFNVRLQVTEHEVTLDSRLQRSYKAARYIASDVGQPARLQIYLRPVASAPPSSCPNYTVYRNQQ